MTKEIIGFINTFFHMRIKKTENGLRCSFITNESEQGYVMLQRGKSGWNRKPIMNSPYIIIESDMMGVLEELSKKFDINENHYEIIKDELNKRIYNKVKDFQDPHL